MTRIDDLARKFRHGTITEAETKELDALEAVADQKRPMRQRNSLPKNAFKAGCPIPDNAWPSRARSTNKACDHDFRPIAFEGPRMRCSHCGVEEY